MREKKTCSQSVNLTEPSPFQDSCQGDSGGPIWTLDKNGEVATLVAIISRGAECAEKDQPGIGARVTTSLKWIKDHMYDQPPKGSDNGGWCTDWLPTDARFRLNNGKKRSTIHW